MSAGEKNKRTPGYVELKRFLRTFRRLAESRALYVIVGGIAANLHGLARGTKDIDLLIPKDIENTQKILDCLGETLVCGIAKEISPEEVVAKPFTIIGDIPRVDLLLRAGKVKFDDVYERRISKNVEGVRLPYVSLEDLILSKDTDRPFDQLEIKELKEILALKKGRKRK